MAISSYLVKHKQCSIEELRKVICRNDHEKLRKILADTDCPQYFTKDNAKAASSIMSVLMANIKPLRFLRDKRDTGGFSLQDYISKVDQGFSGWLSLAAKSATRELTIPLNAVVITNLMRYDAPKNRRIWFIMDELAAFRRFPSLTKLM